MQFTPLASILALAILVVTAALPNGASVSSAILPGYATGVMEFVGTIHGVNFTAKGTAEDIYAAFAKAHPEAAAQDAALNATDVTPHILNKSGLLCCKDISQDWYGADTGRIDQGISYLKHLGGTCNVGASACVRISCSWDSAIYLCNDNPWLIAPMCDYIASYASDLTHECTYETPSPMYQLTCGQEFDTDGYNVIVHSDKC